MITKINYTFTLLIFIFFTACSFKPIYNKLGVDTSSGIYIFPDTLNKIKVGLTKEDVQNILGTPTIISSFDSNTWYYIYQRVKSFAIFDEKIIDQKILILTFSNNEILEKIDKKNLKNIKNIPFDKTEQKVLYKKDYIEPDLF